jgi:hypothetical protein
METMETRLTVAELREIEKHKYFMSLARKEDVGFEAAKADWLANYADAWQRQRQSEMLRLQRDEINRYKWIESEKSGKDLGRQAVFEWINKYAASWRDWYNREFDAETPEEAVR